MDLYLPRDEARALCVFLHGGGWRMGSRRDGPGAPGTRARAGFEVMAGLGLAVASIDYRLSAEATFPAQLEDVASATTYLREHRDELGLPEPLALWGASAGGHLAALHALHSIGTDAAASAVVCWYAPTDLDRLSTDVDDAGGVPDRSATSREGLLLGAALDAIPDQVRAASPVNAVAAGAPPFLLVHGNSDLAVPLAQSRRFADALVTVGGTAAVEEVPGGSHMLPELDDAETRQLIERSTAFILERCSG